MTQQNADALTKAFAAADAAAYAALVVAGKVVDELSGNWAIYRDKIPGDGK